MKSVHSSLVILCSSQLANHLVCVDDSKCGHNMTQTHAYIRKDKRKGQHRCDPALVPKMHPILPIWSVRCSHTHVATYDEHHLPQIHSHTHSKNSFSLVKSYGSPTCVYLSPPAFVCQPYISTPTSPHLTHPTHLSLFLSSSILCVGWKNGGGESETRHGRLRGVQDRGRCGRALWGLSCEFWLPYREEKMWRWWWWTG